MALSQQRLNTDGISVYTSSGNTAITTIFVTNVSASSVNVTLHLYSSGGTASDTTAIWKDIAVTGKDTFSMNNERIIMGNGDVLAGTSSANDAINVTLSYTEV